MIYGYNLEKQRDAAISPDQLLLGGFLFAISTGSKLMLEIKTDLEFLEIGDITILFGESVNLYAILFTTEYVPLVKKKLERFMKEIEILHSKELKNYTGSPFRIRSNNLENLIIDSFRKHRPEKLGGNGYK